MYVVCSEFGIAPRYHIQIRSFICAVPLFLSFIFICHFFLISNEFLNMFFFIKLLSSCVIFPITFIPSGIKCVIKKQKYVLKSVWYVFHITTWCVQTSPKILLYWKVVLPWKTNVEQQLLFLLLSLIHIKWREICLWTETRTALPLWIN